MLQNIFDEFLNDKQFPNIIEFIEGKWGWGQPLFPTQKFVFKLIYGLPLDKSERVIRITDKFNEHVKDTLSEYDYFKFLVSEERINIDEPPTVPFFRVIEAMGRRGTKSFMSAALGGYELYRLLEFVRDPHTFYGIARTDEIKVTIVSNTKDQSGNIFNQLREGSSNSQTTKQYLSGKPTEEKIRFFTPGQLERYKKAGINPKSKKGLLTAFVGAASSRNIRGSGSIVIILDEFAFFLNNNGTQSDEAVYTALSPSMSMFGIKGKFMALSSPASKQGKFYELYDMAMDGLLDYTLALRVPTWGMNPVIPSDFLRTEFQAMGANIYGCEYGANFSDTRYAWIDDESKLIACINGNQAPTIMGRKYIRYFWGIDLAQSSDALGIAIGHKENEKTILDYKKDYFGNKLECVHRPPDSYYEFSKRQIKQPQDYEDIVAEVKELYKRFPISYGIMDQWSGIVFKQLFEKSGIKGLDVIHFTESLNSEMFAIWKYLINTGLFDMDDDEYTMNHIMMLEAEHRSKNIIIVKAPSKKGYHDDLASAIAKMIYAAYKSKGSSTKIISGTVSSSGAGGIIARGSYAGYHAHKSRLHGSNNSGHQTFIRTGR